MSLYEIAIIDPVLQTAQIRDQSLVLWRRGEDQDLFCFTGAIAFILNPASRHTALVI